MHLSYLKEKGFKLISNYKSNSNDDERGRCMHMQIDKQNVTEENSMYQSWLTNMMGEFFNQ